MNTPEMGLDIAQRVLQSAIITARLSDYVSHSFAIDEAPLTRAIPPEVKRHLPPTSPQDLGDYVLRTIFLGDRACPPVSHTGVLSNIVSLILKQPDGHYNINYCLGQQNSDWDSVIMRRLITHTDKSLLTAGTLHSSAISFPEALHAKRALSLAEIMEGAAPILADLNIPSDYAIITSNTSPLLEEAHNVDIAEAAAIKSLLDK